MFCLCLDDVLRAELLRIIFLESLAFLLFDNTRNPVLIYPQCGIMPITHVDKAQDQLPSNFNLKKLNGVAQGAYKLYDATAMHGLPVAVQVVGQRLEEEKVLAIMQRIEDALGDDKYQLMEID